MFRAYEALRNIPHHPSPFEPFFLPQLNPIKFSVVALGFITSLMVHIKLRQQFRSQGTLSRSYGPLTMKNFMKRIVLLMTIADMFGTATLCVCLMIYWKLYHYYYPQFPLVRTNYAC